jgi:hypothetical protein
MIGGIHLTSSKRGCNGAINAVYNPRYVHKQFMASAYVRDQSGKLLFSGFMLVDASL